MTLGAAANHPELLAQYAEFRSRHRDVLDASDLVEPTGKFFPDAFEASPEGILTLFRRALTYAPVSESVDVQFTFLQAESEGGGGGGCSSGGCGTGGGAITPELSGVVSEMDGAGYMVPLAVAAVGDPQLLTAHLARAVGGIVLLESGEEPSPAEFAARSELVAVSCGFGVILMNGAAVFRKGCGGLKAHHGTVLGLSELAFATALFCKLHQIKPGTARKHMPVTQAEAFDEAWAWVDSNDVVVQQLREAPELVLGGHVALEPTKGFFSRFLSKFLGSKDTVPAFAPSPKVAPRELTEEQRKRRAEARALVEEALRDG
jgi:hypothetical protein